MSIEIDRFSERELMEINTRVVERIRWLRRTRDRQAALGFKVGDAVFVPERDRGWTLGKVVQVSQSTVTVESVAGHYYRVSASLLRSA